MLYKFSLLSLALFSSSIEAIALNHGLAAATNTPQEYGAFPHTSIPSPTQAPNPHDFELRRRESAQRTLLAAPDNTCGYFSGISGSSFQSVPHPTPSAALHLSHFLFCFKVPC
jgi:hypothetical protein